VPAVAGEAATVTGSHHYPITAWVTGASRSDSSAPVRCIKDAAMQALGNYASGRLLFLGLGTGVGATVIVDDIVVPIEVGSVKLNPKECMADRLSKAALKNDRPKHWSEAVLEAIELFQNVFNPDQTVLGGGNARFVDDLPSNCRCVDNRSAYLGAQRLWENSDLFASAYATSWRIHRNLESIKKPGDANLLTGRKIQDPADISAFVPYPTIL
jgi:predicted NBD/HSP70 family sugar kinase